MELTTPACPLKDTIGRDVRRRSRPPALTRVEISWGAQVRSAPGAAQGHHAGREEHHPRRRGEGRRRQEHGRHQPRRRRSRTLGAKVGILDADIYGPSVPILTGVTDRPDLQRRPEARARCAPTASQVMSIGFLVDPDQALIWRGPMVTGALIQLLRDVDVGRARLPRSSTCRPAPATCRSPSRRTSGRPGWCSSRRRRTWRSPTSSAPS